MIRSLGAALSSLSLLLALPACAQQPSAAKPARAANDADPALWVVKDKDTTVYLFGTIYAADLTSVEAATGFDHIVYGWMFFGIVMAAVLAIGWRCRSTPPRVRRYRHRAQPRRGSTPRSTSCVRGGPPTPQAPKTGTTRSRSSRAT